MAHRQLTHRLALNQSSLRAQHFVTAQRDYVGWPLPLVFALLLSIFGGQKAMMVGMQYTEGTQTVKTSGFFVDETVKNSISGVNKFRCSALFHAPFRSAPSLLSSILTLGNRRRLAMPLWAGLSTLGLWVLTKKASAVGVRPITWRYSNQEQSSFH